VLDPATGYPANAGAASVAVLCESGALSDALSTAFLVLGREKSEAVIARAEDFLGAIFVDADGTCHATANMPFSNGK
jgi:thiamine biosynthesis lipoprotein